MNISQLTYNFNVFLLKRLRNAVRLKLFLYRIVWLIPTNIRRVDTIWRELEALSREKIDVSFINIGANDGLSNDPLTEFIFTKNWKGLLIEPVVSVFDRLEQIYGKNHNIRCLNVAVADINSTKDFYYIESAPELHPGVDQIGSFSKKHVLNHKDIFPGCLKYLKSVKIPCQKLQTILMSNKTKNIDLYLIDTEGYDYQIIKQINFTKSLPLLIIFEHLHLSPKDKKAAFQLLRRNNYKLQIEKANTIAKLNKKSRRIKGLRKNFY